MFTLLLNPLLFKLLLIILLLFIFSIGLLTLKVSKGFLIWFVFEGRAWTAVSQEVQKLWKGEHWGHVNIAWFLLHLSHNLYDDISLFEMLSGFFFYYFYYFIKT